jgi:regulatory protein
MIITSFKKVRNDIRVTFDDGSVIVIDYRTVFDFGLRVHDELSQPKMNELKHHSSLQKCKDSSFRYLSMRLHSIKELKQKLKLKKYDEQIIEEVTAKLLQNNYLNDEKFAEQFIKDKTALKKMGSTKIKIELLKRGIPKEIISEKLKIVSNDESFDNCLQLAQKKINLLRSRSKEIKNEKNKVYSFLLSKGYESETIASVLNKLFLANSEENEFY